MTLLATFKHISSKNADYGAAEAYLTFEHDEFTMKPTLDENGRLIPREDYRISSINCGDEDFAVACMRANLRYEKNQKREDVKSHHYIISFDPRDGTDNGLTVDRAQELGEQFCKEHFPGHQALICTHPDGHNHSGNIHVHIVINSLRIYEVPLLPYMDRPADTREGCKHRCTNTAMEYFKSEVMEMCHREGLYQIDLLNGRGICQSMSKAGCPYDNAPMERFYNTLKNELIYPNHFYDAASLDEALNRYVYVWYNHVRPHSYNDWKTPFEARYAG